MNHENWQFSFVQEIGQSTIWVPSLGWAYPLNVQFSNLTDGSVPFEDMPTVTVSGDHTRVYYAIPSDVSGAELSDGSTEFTLTGRIKILKKTKGFPRGVYDTEATIVVNEDFSTSLPSLTRDEPFLYIDHEIADSNNPLWYYTAFYEGQTDLGDTKWGFSPVYGHGRAFSLNSGESSYGLDAYEYMPRAFKVLDTRKHSRQLYRFLQVLGKPLDELSERLQRFLDTKHNPASVDAAFLPYIDHLLGWPTNFELSEPRRRFETSTAVSVWKSKGANDALEVTLQNITGWDAELEEGYKYVLTTATAEDVLDASTPPTGWVESEDGVWADFVNGQAFNGTVDLSGASTVNISGDSNQNVRVLSDFSEDGWIEPRGVLVDLYTEGGNVLPTDVATNKVNRLLALLGVYYAKFKINIREAILEDDFTESMALTYTETHTD